MMIRRQDGYSRLIRRLQSSVLGLLLLSGFAAITNSSEHQPAATTPSPTAPLAAPLATTTAPAESARTASPTAASPTLAPASTAAASRLNPTVAASEAAPSMATPQPQPLSDPFASSRGSWGQPFADLWGLQQIGLLDSQGLPRWAYPPLLEPVRVALIDSGLDYTHPDFDRQQLWRNPDEQPNGRDDDNNGLIDDLIGWDFVNDTNNPWDDHGHGTHLAGIIAATRDNNLGIAGIAPNARLMILKVADAGGHASGSQVARAIRYATDKGAQLIHLSLGGAVPSEAERAAVRYALEREVILISAAGNRASGDPRYGYEQLPGLLVVGALDSQGQRAPFSDWGPHLKLLAPGVDVLSLRAAGSDFLRRNGNPDYSPGSAVVAEHYYRATGSSFAAPFVTGVAALILGRDPWLEPGQLRRMLLQSAEDIAPAGVDQNHGYGGLDALAALNASPDRFIEATLGHAELDPQQHLRIFGTADADQFFQARLDYGVGSDPQLWRSLLTGPLTEPRQQQLLIDLDASLLPKGRLLTVRLQTQHLDGGIRESRLQLKLPGGAR